MDLYRRVLLLSHTVRTSIANSPRSGCPRMHPGSSPGILSISLYTLAYRHLLPSLVIHSSHETDQEEAEGSPASECPPPHIESSITFEMVTPFANCPSTDPDQAMALYAASQRASSPWQTRDTNGGGLRMLARLDQIGFVNNDTAQANWQPKRLSDQLEVSSPMSNAKSTRDPSRSSTPLPLIPERALSPVPPAGSQSPGSSPPSGEQPLVRRTHSNRDAVRARSKTPTGLAPISETGRSHRRSMSLSEADNPHLGQTLAPSSALRALPRRSPSVRQGNSSHPPKGLPTRPPYAGNVAPDAPRSLPRLDVSPLTRRPSARAPMSGTCILLSALYQ